MSQPRFVIIGAGIVGAAAAYRLASAGRSVTVADCSARGASTAAAAGVISPGSAFAYGAPAPTGFEALAVAASHTYADIVQRLAADGFSECGYSTLGALVAATSTEEQQQLGDVLAVVERRRRLGAENIGEPRMLTASQARALHPMLGSAVLGALYLPEVGRVDGHALRSALLEAAQRRGATYVPDRLVLSRSSGRTHAVGSDRTVYEADAYLVAAGSNSNAALNGVTADIPVGAERGEMLYCRVDRAPATLPIVMGFAPTRYVVPTAPGVLGLGATRDPATHLDGATLGGIASILAESLRVFPSLRTAVFERSSVGHRPTTPDLLPMLGPVVEVPEVFVATGHGHFGLMQGPHGGQAVAEIMLDMRPSLDLRPYSPERFVSHQ